MRRDQHIVMVGLMATGKTTIGRLVADALGRPFLDCDERLTARAGRSAAHIAEARGLAELHRLEAEVLLDSLAARDPSAITAAASTIDDPACQAALRVPFVVWLRADSAVLAERARSQSHRPVSDDVAGQLDEQAARRDALFAAIADLELDATLTPAEIVGHILAEY